MNDARTELSTEQVREADLTDWRLLRGLLKARYRTNDFATGLEFVNLIGESAEEADHHPDITLTYTEVILTLHSHDVQAITSRDVRMARRISEHAASLGLDAEVADLTEIELGLDTTNARELGPMYAALLGSELRDGEPVDPSGQSPAIWWQVPEGSTHASPQRWHLDVWVPEDDAPRRLKAVLDAGGELISDEQAPSFWVVADADGNRSCICTSADPHKNLG